ncbi:unnamed protein product [Protopolystoma xenopodis]|uniref:Uncharacterized protein n=1 Tax=Protopolystoma xenopodis TaxID=117903 RepID=A0A448WAM4_9PLAT|nr:unnamed protein product [Protopolystoma xenopodis]
MRYGKCLTLLEIHIYSVTQLHSWQCGGVVDVSRLHAALSWGVDKTYARNQNHCLAVLNLAAQEPSNLVLDFAIFENLEQMMPMSMSVPVNLPLPMTRLSSFSSPPSLYLIVWGPLSGLRRNCWCEDAPRPFFPLNRKKHTPLDLQVDSPV